MIHNIRIGLVIIVMVLTLAGIIGVFFFPIILAIVEDNWWLIFIYAIWWFPGIILIKVLAEIGSALTDYL